MRARQRHKKNKKVTVAVEPEHANLHHGDNDEVSSSKIKNWKARMDTKMSKYKDAIKSREDPHYKLAGIKLPSEFAIFLRANTARFKLLIRSLEVFPFELAIHLLHDLQLIAIMLFLGFLMIAAWMAFEEVALYGKKDVIQAFFITIDAIIIALDVAMDLVTTWLFGPILGVLQYVICQMTTEWSAKNMFGSNAYNLICNDIPGPGNPTVIPPLDLDKLIPEVWDFMIRSKDTCAEFSSGVEELQVLPKLIFSPFICPILQHVRPVPWLYDVFWYTLGWATWTQGIESTYQAPWASAVTNQETTHGIHNNRKCDAPPNALFCFCLGFGFLIVEILVPVLIVMLAVKPLKNAIRAALGIALSFVYHLLSFTLYVLEKATQTVDWAGKKYAWLIVLAAPLVILMPLGSQIYGDEGLFGGAAVGVLVGAAVIVEHSADESDFGGPSHKIIMGTSASLASVVAVGGILNHYA